VVEGLAGKQRVASAVRTDSGLNTHIGAQHDLNHVVGELEGVQSAHSRQEGHNSLKTASTVLVMTIRDVICTGALPDPKTRTADTLTQWAERVQTWSKANPAGKSKLINTTLNNANEIRTVQSITAVGPGAQPTGRAQSMILSPSFLLKSVNCSLYNSILY
jgi:hypothetical protein